MAFTDKMLKGQLVWGKSLKGEVGRMGGVLLISLVPLWDRCGVRAPLIAQVERRVGWAILWDATLNFGFPRTWELQLLSRVLSHHGRGNHPL